jgi:molybdopterin-guanine dinucleotide biosynthesis protein A
MNKLDGMLMIGSAGANVGKTQLACALINKFGKDQDIVGIKVTTITAKGAQCPRGGWGCGVCSSLEGDFCITEETDSTSGKDTARLLAAGASRVFWLRVMKTHLKEGMTALLDKIGPDAVLVCESNSLRQVVEPGLFLMVKGRHLKAWKSSAEEVKEYADRIVTSKGDGFDFDIDRVKLTDGKWTILKEATAIILAGGGSHRMGVDKAMLPINDKLIVETICERLRGSFSQILISANESEKLAFLGLEIIPDRVPGQGPLMGIASAMEASVNELNFVVACDIPYIDLRYVRKMLAEAEEADLVIPKYKSGSKGSKTREGIDVHYEPLFAIYCKSALEPINEVLSSGRRKISDVFSRCKVRYIEPPLQEWFANLNTMDEYEEFRKKHDVSIR